MGKYDVIIIGSGLGGLECGVVLSREGYRVCVLEKNTHTGGCFQTFCRNGHLLDTGIHYVGSLDEGKILRQYFRYFGILDRLKMQRLDEDNFDVICFPDGEYGYAMGHEHFVENLCRHFPEERQKLQQYAQKLKAVGELIGVEQLEQGRFSAGGLEYFYRSAWEEIKAGTENKTLQHVLAGTNMLYGGIPDKSSFYLHAMINNSNLEGAYRFVGGSMQVTDALADVIRQQGGEVWCRSEVTALKAEDGVIRRVEINGKEELEARYIISAIHPQRTLQLLRGDHGIRKAYMSRMNSLENSYGVFTAYLMLKKNSWPYPNRNYYFYREHEVWYDPQVKPANVCLLMATPSPENGDYADVVSLMTPMYIGELQPWISSVAGKRGAAYEDFKAAKTEELIDMVTGRMPRLKECIESVFATTPLSFRDFTGTEEGSAYGIVKNYHSPLTTLIASHTKIRNLWLTGQNMNVHGALGVTLTAMLTCGDLLGTAYLARKIGKG